MALRDFVTGSDMCTPDEGAGPSNAAATLANSLLGKSAKDQERLREVKKASTPSSCRILRPSTIFVLQSECAACRCCSARLYCTPARPKLSVVLQLPGVHGLPGPSVYGGAFTPTVDSAAQAAAEGQ